MEWPQREAEATAMNVANHRNSQAADGDAEHQGNPGGSTLVFSIFDNYIDSRGGDFPVLMFSGTPLIPTLSGG